jgi:hypothetical protein
MSMFYCHNFETPPTWKAKFLYFSQEQGSPVITPGIGLAAAVILRPMASRPLSCCEAPIWDPKPNFLLLPLIIFRQLRICWCEAPCLTRSRVCSFRFLLGIDSATFLRSESHGTHNHILLAPFFRLPQSGGPGSYIYFPQEQGIPFILSGTEVTFIFPRDVATGRTQQETPLLIVLLSLRE